MRLAPMALMAGLATGVATVAVHQRWWGLVLALAASAAMTVAAPPGAWTRLAFAVAYVGGVGLAAVPRPEGDYLIAANMEGLTVLGAALAMLVFALATLRHSRQGPTKEQARFLP